jgi:hypothetical protein
MAGPPQPLSTTTRLRGSALWEPPFCLVVDLINLVGLEPMFPILDSAFVLFDRCDAWFYKPRCKTAGAIFVV